MNKTENEILNELNKDIPAVTLVETPSGTEVMGNEEQPPGGLGRRVPKDMSHISRSPLRALGRETIATVEKNLILPSWHTKHDQGEEGACVGFGTSLMLSIINENQVRRQGQKEPYIRYNPWWLWKRAKEIDEWPETTPEDSQGTSVKAACQVLIDKGHVVWENEADPNSVSEATTDYGISTVRWATTVDEMRTAIDKSQPLSIGVNWYSKFDVPEYINGEWWISFNKDIGHMRGGHCACIYGASDHRQAFRLKNSWGARYPEVWIPYDVMGRLIEMNGEVALITDR